MTKIMLVEDDNNLREIYEARLLAEGYDIVSAKDGEEALALAVKEKPDLIISDVMMPKISGFDMLDILRSTPEIRDTKVIMMTALSQSEDKLRADKLGADRYLVKSQVTLEDVAKVAKEVLSGEEEPAPEAAPPVADSEAATPVLPVTPDPASSTATSPQSTTPVPEPTASQDEPAVAPLAAEPPATQDEPAAPPAATEPPAAPPEPPVVATLPADPPQADPAQEVSDDFGSPESDPIKLDPIGESSAELDAIADAAAADTETAQTTEQESAAIEDQIKEFVGQTTPDDDATSDTPASSPEPTDTTPQAVPEPAAEPTGFTQPPTEDIPVQPAPPAESSPESQPDLAATSPSPAPQPAADTPTASTNTESTQPTAPAEEPKVSASNEQPDGPEDTSTEVAHKKVIAPLGGGSPTAPNLNELLAKEKQRADLAPGAEVIPPATTVIQPGGKIVTPATTATPTDTTRPGNVVHPAGGDPSSVAL